MAIKRVWHGWTTKGDAECYQKILLETVIPGIEAKKMPGYLGIEVLREEQEEEVEFVTMMTFETLEQIKAFQGEDYTKSYVPQAAQKVLKRWDQTSTHYETIDARTYE